MYDIYESISLYEKNHPENSICKPYEQGMSLLKRFAAYLILNKSELNLNKKKREKFLKIILESIESQNILDLILSSDYKLEQKKQLIEFFYLSNNIIEEIKNTKVKIPKSFESIETCMIEKLKEQKTINKMTNLRFGDSVPIIFHISFINDKDINLFFLNNVGVFVSVGYNVNFDSQKCLNFNEYLLIFKALGDDSRFKIVLSLWKNPQNASQLSEKLKLTLPTITHHIKMLCQAGIISPIISTINHKGTMYEINLQLIREIKGVLENALS